VCLSDGLLSQVAYFVQKASERTEREGCLALSIIQVLKSRRIPTPDSPELLISSANLRSEELLLIEDFKALTKDIPLIIGSPISIWQLLAHLAKVIGLVLSFKGGTMPKGVHNYRVQQ